MRHVSCYPYYRIKPTDPTHILLSLFSDPFVKVYIMMGAKRLKKKRTVLKKREINPVWNEAFSFNIPNRILHRVSVMILVKHHSERGREKIIGKLMIGASSTDEAVDHWNAMSSTGKSVARWHHLIEEK